MKTEMIVVDKNVDEENSYAQAVEILKSGEVVAFPTETVYGLGADATNFGAVSKIFEAKGRPADNPLIVHVDSKESALNYVKEVSPKALQCMDAFWPGALTLIMQAKPETFANNVTANLQTVGIRVPNHPVALKLLQEVKLPLAAPSANTSGKPSPTLASHVRHDMDGRVPLILDGGATEIGIESTVLDTTCEPPVILRPGKITKEQIESVIGTIRSSSGNKSNVPKSPGMKYAHYAPTAPLYLIEDEKALIEKAIQYVQEKGKRVAVISEMDYPLADFNFPLSMESLYASLRECDLTDADLILAPVKSSDQDQVALMNRLEKAADHKWFS